ncbi:NADH dehydrogenase [ubiquinone] flavoprotein 3, mitochondrial isoform X2 [Tympanuchus pallidicinctus]|uniref:NADH dehydrogenase [ubiquinone] flavoprotein 3, mitochondrial isoform X2 n=1 Tax=Tympanuchus pallidicinctus TaxID=109042 RepID=UPI0022870720|nr:NADH dehydrogenase [ubiquinone] flavoprotein 3, mitochondrial isoform X2 [Tympanuchus pallidicinctus]
MAAPSLLSCGRMAARKAVQLEAWGLRGATLCTRPGGSGTPPDSISAKEGGSTLNTNPKEASEPDEDLRMLMSKKTVVAFPQRVIVSSLEEARLGKIAKGGGVRKELAEEETSSSSSSDSDSSSDSEEENDDGDESGVSFKTRVEFPRRDSIFSETTPIKTSQLPRGDLSQKDHKEYVAKKKPSKMETDVPTIKKVAFSKASVSHETLKSKARDPNTKSTPKEADQQKLVLEPHLKKQQVLTDATLKSDYVEEKSPRAQMATTQLKAPSVTQEGKKQNLISRREGKKVKETQKSEAVQVASPKQEEEISESTALVMGTKEETVQEAGVQTGESSTIDEATAAAQPAPEEFDNSTYKNLQHHEYNIYTFIDFHVDLSKFRQPQPSSGRPSPRH